VVFKPVAVPNWLNHALGLLPFLYLGVAVLFAATGSAYIICEYDPFVPLFRRDGPATMLALGGLFLLVGLFVARPYCRFFCPYGALLQLCSLVSRRRVTIYPDRCIDCHLCDESCPVAAIRRTAPPPSAAARAQARKWLLASLLLLPLLVAGGAFVGSRVSQPLARMHSTVRLADRIHLEESGQAADATDPSKAFRRTAQTPQALYQEAGVIGGRFKTGGAWLGAFMGLVIALKLVSLAVRRPRTQYEADRATCVGCARCFDYCPGEKGLLDPEIAARTKTL
jgi:NAD-dependent dihydropyrimidine dehydrogenase PreA subunit